MTFCWRKVIENKGQHMEKGVETEKKTYSTERQRKVECLSLNNFLC